MDSGSAGSTPGVHFCNRRARGGFATKFEDFLCSEGFSFAEGRVVSSGSEGHHFHRNKSHRDGALLGRYGTGPSQAEDLF